MRNLYEAYQQVRLQESLDKPYHLNDVTADNPMMVAMVERSLVVMMNCSSLILNILTDSILACLTC